MRKSTINIILQTNLIRLSLILGKYTDYMNQNHTKSINLDPITPLDVIKITSRLKSKTSNGHDSISSKLMKNSIEQILIPITHILNQSLATAVVPEDMKIARIIPIYKSGDTHEFNNYQHTACIL